MLKGACLVEATRLQNKVKCIFCPVGVTLRQRQFAALLPRNIFPLYLFFILNILIAYFAHRQNNVWLT